METEVITSGTLCTHDDLGGQHRALVLNIVGKSVHALFVTSKPAWNPDCRPLTPAEYELFCMTRRNTRSYAAPVIRHMSDFRSPIARVEHPSLDSYRLEFAAVFSQHFGRHLHGPLCRALHQLETPCFATNNTTALWRFGLVERFQRPENGVSMFRRTPFGNRVATLLRADLTRQDG